MIQNTSVVRFENVGLRYGSGPEALQDISFDLKAGSFHFLTGPSGAGKTSLLKLMYLGLRPSRGLINLFGEDVAVLPRNKLPALRRQIGVVFQDFRLLEHLTAMQNVALPLRIVGGLGENKIRDYVAELLAWVGLEEQIDALPETLSGGEKQRVAIARAVIARPKLLLADEPTGNVDKVMGRRLIHLFTQLNKLGTAVVVATHDTEMVRRVGQQQIKLDAGRQVADGVDGNA